jgi:hypothetical protein
MVCSGMSSICVSARTSPQATFGGPGREARPAPGAAIWATASAAREPTRPRGTLPRAKERVCQASAHRARLPRSRLPVSVSAVPRKSRLCRGPSPCPAANSWGAGPSFRPRLVLCEAAPHGDPREAACRGRCSHHRETPNETVLAADRGAACHLRGSGAPRRKLPLRNRGRSRPARILKRMATGILSTADVAAQTRRADCYRLFT